VDATILKPDGTALMTFGFGTTGSAIDMPVLPADGIYAILLDVRNAQTGNVTLTLSTDLLGTIAINGASVPLTMSRPAQNARLTFAGTAGQTVTVRLSAQTIGGTQASLLAPDGTVLTSTTSSASAFNLASQTLATSGTYTVKIDPSGTRTGSITVSVTSP
jgi:hypothetical protein